MDVALIIIAVTALMIFANAFYVAAEFATVNSRRTRISQRAAAGNQFAILLEPIVSSTQQLDIYVAACQIGITLSSLVLGFYGQAEIASRLAPILVNVVDMQETTAVSLSATGVLLLLTAIQIVLGELLPKSVALRYPEETALLVVLPMRWSIVFFRPLIALCNGTGALILRLLQVPPAPHHGHVLSPEEIDLLAKESARGGLLEAGEHQLLHNVFRASELTAAEVMVPRTRLVSASVDTPVSILLELITTSGHTRIPIYRDTIDSIVGSVHLKDLFRLSLEKKHHVGSVLRKVCYVPETKLALAVWNQLQQENSYVAIVLDEFGGTAGMITIADLLEEIFGELQDEFDENEPSLISRGLDGYVRLHGEVLITDVNEWFGLVLPDEEVNTIGGLIMATLGRLPEAGDEITIGAARLRVETVNGPAVTEVCLSLPQDHAVDVPELQGDHHL